MISKLAPLALNITIALSLGAYLTWVSIRGVDKFGAVTIGGWVAFPESGTKVADPYAKARLARDASVSLGAAEGVTFFAERDEAGDRLNGSCVYLIVGASPTARLWTMTALLTDQSPLKLEDPFWPTSLHSQSILYQNSGDFQITAAATARSDNWLALKVNESFIIAFTLYDSPVATNKGLIDTAFPTLRKVNCDA